MDFEFDFMGWCGVEEDGICVCHGGYLCHIQFLSHYTPKLIEVKKVCQIVKKVYLKVDVDPTAM